MNRRWRDGIALLLYVAAVSLIWWLVPYHEPEAVRSTGVARIGSR